MTVAGSISGVVSDCDSRVGVGLSGWMLFAKLQAGKRLRGAPALELGPTCRNLPGGGVLLIRLAVSPRSRRIHI
jgi:hypothetical protein